MATRYLRKKPDGTWEYSNKKPTDPNEPVITEDQVNASMGVGAFTEGTIPSPPSQEQIQGFVEDWMGEPVPERPKVEGEIDPSRRHVGLTFGGEGPGPSLGEGTRVHLAGQYTPFDERRIRKLYDERSKIATDPELREDERQGFLDDVDEQISMIPPISPQMKEPTAQDTFDASLITSPDGQVGLVNKSGEFKAIEKPEEQAQRTAEFQKLYQDMLFKTATTDPKTQAQKFHPEVARKNTIDIFKTSMLMSAITEAPPVGGGMAESAERVSFGGGGLEEVQAVLNQIPEREVSGVLSKIAKQWLDEGRSIEDVVAMIEKLGKTTIKVRDKNGRLGEIPVGQLKQALAEGFTLVKKNG